MISAACYCLRHLPVGGACLKGPFLLFSCISGEGLLCLNHISVCVRKLLGGQPPVRQRGEKEHGCARAASSIVLLLLFWE